MKTEPQHLFSVAGETLVPTDLVRGPWDHGFQHGGAVAAALGWAAKRCLSEADRNEAGAESSAEDGLNAGADFVLCRQTTEILRPVPAAPLRFAATLDHPGRRGRVVSSSLWHEDRLVARSSSQWARARPGAAPAVPAAAADPAMVPDRPGHSSDPGESDFDYPRPGFNCDVFELRPVKGTTEDPGPGVCWVRMKTQLVAGEALDPVAILTTLADLGNAVGWDYSPAGEPMVNPDLTLQVLRYPEGEWVCLESSSTVTSAGIGMMETTLWDDHGKIGRVLSTQMESTMPLSAAPTTRDNQSRS